jgi:hypothetical protein
MHPNRSDIGAYIHCANLAVPPAARDAGTREGPAFPLGTYRSAVLVASVGSLFGDPAPTGVTVRYGLESREGPEGDWEPVLGDDGEPLALEVTAPGVAREMDLNLNALLPDLHDQVRVTEEVAFPDGTTPAVVTGALLVFGGAQTLPI